MDRMHVECDLSTARRLAPLFRASCSGAAPLDVEMREQSFGRGARERTRGRQFDGQRSAANGCGEFAQLRCNLTRIEKPQRFGVLRSPRELCAGVAGKIDCE